MAKLISVEAAPLLRRRTAFHVPRRDALTFCNTIHYLELFISYSVEKSDESIWREAGNA